MPRGGFHHHFVQVIVPFIALRPDILRLNQSPKVMPYGSVFVNISRIRTVIFSNYLGAATAAECAGYCSQDC
jgi:hypothetical protein